MTNYNRLLQEGIGIKNKLIGGDIKVSSALMGIKSILISLKLIEKHEWVERELAGYNKFETLKELEENVPEYRIVSRQFYDAYKIPLVVEDQSLKDYIGRIPIGQSIGFIEENINQFWVFNSTEAQLIRKHFGYPIIQYHVSPANLSQIIHAVKNRSLELLNTIIDTLEPKVNKHEKSENKSFSSKEKKKRGVDWTKGGTIIAGIALLLVIFGFLGYPTIKDFFAEPIILDFQEKSGILCEHEVPERNSTQWQILTEMLPVDFNMSSYDSIYESDKINPSLYYPWGFIITIARGKDIDIINPKLLISYDKDNFYHHATIVEDSLEFGIESKPKTYSATSDPIKYQPIRNLQDNLISPNKAEVYLPDLNEKNEKILISVRFLVDLNHYCNEKIPVKFQVISETQNIKSDEKIGIIEVMERP